MSRLPSISSNFVFNLPSDFVPTEIEERYVSLLEKNHFQYETILDYINSTILSVDFPGLSIETPEQSIKRGKKIKYKPATNVQDIVTSMEFTVEFLSTDSDANYWMLFNIFNYHYLDTTFTKYIEPFEISAVDFYRDVIYRIQFREIIMTNLEGNKFNYNDIPGSDKTFTATFSFNFHDIKYVLNQNTNDPDSLLNSDSFNNPIDNPLKKGTDNPATQDYI